MLTKIKNLFSKEEPAESNQKDLKKNGAEKTEPIADSKPVSENKSNTPALNGNGEAASVKSTVEIPDKEKDSEVKAEVKDSETKSEHSTEEIKQEVIKVLKTCYDPEIPVDVWELGLIYEINVATNGDVLIVMTLTSPSCPVAGILPGEIEQKVKEHPMVHDCKVQLTFDPPWSQKNMSEVAKLELGFL